MKLVETEFCQLWHGRAEDVLPTLLKESVHLIVTDPPYGVEFTSGHTAPRPIANDGPNDRDLVRSVIQQCVRIVRNNRHLYVFGPADSLEGAKISATAELIWDKATPGMGDLSLPWAPSHEPIQFAVSFGRHGGKVGQESLAAKVRRSTVIRHTRLTGRHNRRHPTEKPVGLLRQLIESSSVPGDTVLDPFAGVGSTAVAAVLSGRRAITVELDETYFAVSVERVKAAEAAMRLAVAI